jgi:hypothetical protein
MELTNQEKIDIVNQHIKSCLINMYNLDVALIGEEANSPINQETVDNLNLQLDILRSKKAALDSEIASLIN